MSMKIGNYEVVRLIGKGGMSEVYEVVDPVLGVHRALKAYSYSGDDPDVKRRFVNEGRILARLSHPRIVRVFDVGESEGRPFFVMDLVLDPDGEKRSLADVPDGSADEDEIGRWYDDMRDALACIHARGIVHRDLKLQNVMIGPDGHAVLADFGISRTFKPEGGGDSAPGADVVNTIVRLRDGRAPVMGSVGYMAPELEMGVKATPQSDWYALGVIAYRLLTGTWCDSRTDVVSSLETFDPAWRAIIPKLLHSNPEGRECLSFAEERAAARERAEAAAEKRLDRAKARGRLARHVARFAAAAAILASLAAGAIGWKFIRSRARANARCENLQTRLKKARIRLSMPKFSDVFSLAGWSQDQSEGSAGAISRTDLELAQIDAWVLTHAIFDDLAAEKLSFDDALAAMKLVQRKVMKSEEDDIWGDEYMGVGEEEDRKELFKGAVKRMARFGQRLKSLGVETAMPVSGTGDEDGEPDQESPPAE